MPRTVPALYVSFIRLFPFQGGGGGRAFIHGLAEQNNITTYKSVKPLPLLFLLLFLLQKFLFISSEITYEYVFHQIEEAALATTHIVVAQNKK